MNEFKNLIISIIFVAVLCAGFFVWGYLFHNARATKQLNEANQQLAEQQRKYDDLIRESEARIRESEERVREANKRVSDIRDELLGKVSDDGETIKELSAIIESIKKQRIDI